MYFTPQIDSLKAYIHSLCGLLRNSSLSFSLSLCALLPFIAKVDNLIRNIIVESGKKKFLALCWFLIYFIHQPQASNFCSCTQTGKQTRVFFSSFFFPLISQLSWSGLFWIYPTAPLHIIVTLNWDIAGWTAIRAELHPLPHPSNSNRELSIEGLYFTIASIDVQHYNSWVAPHFTQPNGLTLRAHRGSKQGSFPSFFFFFWSKFYEIQGLGLIESHTKILCSITVCARFCIKLSPLMT